MNNKNQQRKANEAAAVETREKGKLPSTHIFHSSRMLIISCACVLPLGFHTFVSGANKERVEAERKREQYEKGKKESKDGPKKTWGVPQTTSDVHSWAFFPQATENLCDFGLGPERCRDQRERDSRTWEMAEGRQRAGNR